MVELNTQVQTETQDTFKVDIEKMITQSIKSFASVLRVSNNQLDTHSVITIEGWNDSETTRRDIAAYLVGIRALAIDAALNIRANLIKDGIRGREILKNDVYEIIGETNGSLTSKQKSYERNPWICEGLWHLCMAVSQRRNHIHPSGKVIGIEYVHVNAKDHGLDGLAIYHNGDIYGLSLIESKAYKLDPTNALSRALTFFKDLDKDRYSSAIFKSVASIRPSLPLIHQAHISNMFWDDEKTYIVNPHYDSSIDYNWHESKKGFKGLSLKQDKLIVMPNIIQNFDEFFEDISNKMREIVGGL